jgi:hypothetical protein
MMMVASHPAGMKPAFLKGATWGTALLNHATLTGDGGGSHPAGMKPSSLNWAAWNWPH